MFPCLLGQYIVDSESIFINCNLELISDASLFFLCMYSPRVSSTTTRTKSPRIPGHRPLNSTNRPVSSSDTSHARYPLTRLTRCTCKMRMGKFLLGAHTRFVSSFPFFVHYFFLARAVPFFLTSLPTFDTKATIKPERKPHSQTK